MADHVEYTDPEIAEADLSTDVVSPSAMSPIKSSIGSSPLPPVLSNSLNISKRRRLEPFSSSPIDPRFGDEANSRGPYSTPRVLPEKSRSVSTPVRRLSASRTPSLTDRPIPVLSPPSPIQKETSEVSKDSMIGQRRITLSITEEIREEGDGSNDGDHLKEETKGKSPGDVKILERESQQESLEPQNLSAERAAEEDKTIPQDEDETFQLTKWVRVVEYVIKLQQQHPSEHSELDQSFRKEIFDQYRQQAQSSLTYIQKRLDSISDDDSRISNVFKRLSETVSEKEMQKVGPTNQGSEVMEPSEVLDELEETLSMIDDILGHRKS
jgi:hypothetical protein